MKYFWNSNSFFCLFFKDYLKFFDSNFSPVFDPCSSNISPLQRVSHLLCVLKIFKGKYPINKLRHCTNIVSTFDHPTHISQRPFQNHPGNYFSYIPYPEIVGKTQTRDATSIRQRENRRPCYRRYKFDSFGKFWTTLLGGSGNPLSPVGMTERGARSRSFRWSLAAQTPRGCSVRDRRKFQGTESLKIQRCRYFAPATIHHHHPRWRGDAARARVEPNRGNSGYTLGCNGWFDRVAAFLLASSICRGLASSRKTRRVAGSTGGGVERGMNVWGFGLAGVGIPTGP